jgi:hypothetical protein
VHHLIIYENNTAFAYEVPPMLGSTIVFWRTAAPTPRGSRG